MRYLALTLVFLSLNTFADFLAVDSVVPNFKAKDIKGTEVELSKYKGKWVVLEWFNKGCPFVKKHYNSNNMQNLQKKYAEKGVVWITLVSSAEGEQGFENDQDALKTAKDWNATPAHIIREPSGTIGKSFYAQVTPHMYIISPEQKLVYQGAIDDNKSANPEDVKTAKNFVSVALDEAMSGKAVTVKRTRPYGCGVKYK